MSEHELTHAVYAFIFNSWNALSDEDKHLLGFDPAVCSAGEEQGLKYLHTLFRDFAQASFERALAARKRRLTLQKDTKEQSC